MKIQYQEAEDVRKIAEEIVKKLNLNYIDLSRVYFVRSKGSKSKYVIARCYCKMLWILKNMAICPK